MYSKTIVCLANSRKHSGRCVAGLEINSGRLGSWIRPVSDRASEELSIDERRYENGQDVQLLDVVTIQLKSHRPHGCQQENHVIDDEYYWRKDGSFKAADLEAVAHKKGPLWIDGDSSFLGSNDRIKTEVAEKCSSSLYLVAPRSCSILVVQTPRKRQVRADFTLENTRYNFAITDPKIEADYLARKDGSYNLDTSTLLCISLGEPFDGNRYKLVAGVVLRP